MKMFTYEGFMAQLMACNGLLRKSGGNNIQKITFAHEEAMKRTFKSLDHV